MRNFLFGPGFIVILILAACQPTGEITVADIFGDHMVLQANKQVNIWGMGIPGSEIVVEFRDQLHKGVVDAEGNWKIQLDPLSYGGPDSLVVSSKSGRIAFHDVMAGEVWVCSGQSNMEMPLISSWARLNNAEEEVNNANYPGLRLFTVQRALAFQPLDSVVTDGWQACTPVTVTGFSATAYFFGREIHRELGVPVGLIHASWGGTVAEAWTSKKSLLELEDFAQQATLISQKAGSMDSLMAQYRKDVERMTGEIAELDAGIEGKDTIFVTGAVDISDWLPMDLPKMWEETDLGSFDGSGWFIKEVDLPQSLLGSDLTLCYGAPDDWDEAWFNGVKVGASMEWGVPRKYRIPDGLARKGKNRIVIRVMDNQGGGGFMNEEKDFAITASTGQVIPIAKGWRAKKGFDFRDVKTKPVSVANPNQPTVLFNAMIHPIIPYTMRGVIWYQGESNAGRAYQYRELFKTLITDWRQAWGEGDFPFLFVQLANYLRKNETPVEDTWAELREAQTMALDLPHTGMAVAIDIGDALDIHPGNKQDVGKRLAINALALVYGEDIPYSGPLYRSMEVQGTTVELSFDHVAGGLKTSDNGSLKGFSMAGPNGRFIWAKASIVGDKVVVSAPAGISEPAAVRYGWASNPDCNLVNSAGLPASPFRTDDFKGITQP